MAHYPLALGQIFTGGVPRDRPAPVYPPELVAARLPPQSLEALLVVDTQGKVREVRIVDENDARQRLFARAVREAVLQWTFEPLRASRWAADVNGTPHDVDSEAQPFRARYVFRFEWTQGGPVVNIAASPAVPVR
ncbi:hypothetical protein EZM97_22115 [Dyella soli]|uniref:TonB C-terminal domain-containing protein n=1 Tax=Dyella soli TaxID=522319 RepID=A0A4R0YT84_9GAMM|nr:hypothetical protein EZM97_22115 [Dyella soli]